jgi:hypothetical protein
MKTELKEITKLKVWSVAKVFLVLGAILGLLSGINFALGAHATLTQYPDMATMSFSELSGQLGDSGYTAQQIYQTYASLLLIKLSYWNILIMPIAFAVMYLVGGVILALLYNLIARYTGGIKMSLK